MLNRAPRQLFGRWRGIARGARHIMVLVVTGAMFLMVFVGPIGAADLTARFLGPTDRYPHGVLGDDLEWSAIRLSLGGQAITFTLPQTRVFEDLTPRIITTVSGRDLAMVVESDADLGARLALYDQTGFVVGTPFIGRRFRWLAPIGAADLDGDGQIELAFVDRPHLRKTLRIFRLVEGPVKLALTPVAQLPGVSNHQIGWDYIAGGIRDCGPGNRVILLPDAQFEHVMAVRFDGRALHLAPFGRFDGANALAQHLTCAE